MKFKYTTEDCEKAKQFLIDIGKFHLLEKELSTDGYTLIDLANSFGGGVLDSTGQEGKLDNS